MESYLYTQVYSHIQQHNTSGKHLYPSVKAQNQMAVMSSSLKDLLVIFLAKDFSWYNFKSN